MGFLWAVGEAHQSLIIWGQGFGKKEIQRKINLSYNITLVLGGIWVSRKRH